MTRRLFGTLCGLVFLVNFGRVAFAPLVEPLQEAFGVGPAAIGLVTTLVWLGTAIPRVPVGYLLTRVPRHLVVLGTGALLALAAAFTATAATLPALWVGAFAVGIASGAYFVSAVPLVGDLYPEAMGRAVGVHGTASQIAAVVAPPVAVVILARLSWRAVFWLLAVGAVVATLALLFVLRDGGELPTTDVDGSRPDFSAALQHWRVILAGIVMVGVAGFAWQGLFNFYVSYLVEAKGLGRGTAGALLTVVFAAGVPAFWYSGRLADRLPNVPYILAILAAFAACLLALTVASSVLSLALVTVVLGYVIHSLFPALDVYLLDSLPQANRSSAYSLYSGLALLVEANGSGVVGLLRDAGVPFETVFVGFAALVIVELVALVLLYLGGRLPRPAGERSARPDG